MASKDSENGISPFSIPWLGPEPTDEVWREIIATGYIAVITDMPLIITDAFGSDQTRER